MLNLSSISENKEYSWNKHFNNLSRNIVYNLYYFWISYNWMIFLFILTGLVSIDAAVVLYGLAFSWSLKVILGISSVRSINSALEICCPLQV